MAYTAYRAMAQINKTRCGCSIGPFEPYLYCSKEHPDDLKSAAMRFLHERCEGLRFDPAADAEFQGAGSEFPADAGAADGEHAQADQEIRRSTHLPVVMEHRADKCALIRFNHSSS